EEVAVDVVDADTQYVGIAVGEHSGKRREVDPVGPEVERLHARDRFPQVLVDAPRVDPRIYRCDPGGLPVYGLLGLANRRIAATLEVRRLIARHAEVPELVVRLSRRE